MGKELSFQQIVLNKSLITWNSKRLAKGSNKTHSLQEIGEGGSSAFPVSHWHWSLGVESVSLFWFWFENTKVEAKVWSSLVKHEKDILEVGKYSPHVNEPTLQTKISSKWIKDLNVRAKPVKLLEDNRGLNLCDSGFGNRFLDIASRA